MCPAGFEGGLAVVLCSPGKLTRTFWLRVSGCRCCEGHTHRVCGAAPSGWGLQASVPSSCRAAAGRLEPVPQCLWSARRGFQPSLQTGSSSAGLSPVLGGPTFPALPHAPLCPELPPGGTSAGSQGAPSPCPPVHCFSVLLRPGCCQTRPRVGAMSCVSKALLAPPDLLRLRIARGDGGLGFVPSFCERSRLPLCCSAPEPTA